MTIPKNFNLETDYMAVDFDGTLHLRPREEPMTVLGPPIEEMAERIKSWLALGMKVELFTARVSNVPFKNINPEDIPEFVANQHVILKEWCKQHLGQELPISCSKNGNLYQLFDDRAVAIERNTGKILGINPPW